MAKINALIEIDEEKLKDLESLSVNVISTDKDSFILPAFSHKDILDYTERNVEDRVFFRRLMESPELNAFFLEEVHDRLTDALYEGSSLDCSLNWEEASYAIDEAIKNVHDAFAEHPEYFPLPKKEEALSACK